jgi:peptidoglycan/xylan/chitin deacetylase (PgdA/CDA1 family)
MDIISEGAGAGVGGRMTLLPPGKRFAFTVLDDTDDSTLDNVGPLYAMLKEYGFRTTKTVWPLDCPEGSRNFFAAETLQDKAYLGFVHELADAGFEVASHGATMESSRRERTLEGLELIRSEFGRYPRLYCNHGQNRENLYWGSRRFRSVPLRVLSRLFGRADGDAYEGDAQGSPYFWGDVSRDVIQYVRNFTFDRLNILAADPFMPYHIPSAPNVRYWFSTADAPDVTAFNRLLTRERIDQLEAEGGVCIVSTHFGKGFVKDGRVNPVTEGLLTYMADKRGWFVPVSDVLDRLLGAGRGRTLTPGEVMQLELRFLTERIKRRRAPGV